MQEVCPLPLCVYVCVFLKHCFKSIFSRTDEFVAKPYQTFWPPFQVTRHGNHEPRVAKAKTMKLGNSTNPSPNNHSTNHEERLAKAKHIDNSQGQNWKSTNSGLSRQLPFVHYFFPASRSSIDPGPYR